MGLNLNYHNEQTPLAPDEKEGLLIPTISTREELNELEQLNIQQALEWFILHKKFSLDVILTEKFILSVHKRMLGNVWDWAGTFRKSNKNIGVDKHQIAVRLRQLIDNCRFWIEHQTYTPVEIALQFKHELVFIHLFPNGNGIHSRLMADILMKHIFNLPTFSWGKADLIHPNDLRAKYIQALKKADHGDFKDLIAFAQS